MATETRTDVPPRGRTVRLPSSHDIHFHEAGSGPAVVFVHGSGPGANAYSNFFPNFRKIAAAGYRCLLPDMIGFGYSSKPAGIDYTLELFTSNLIELLNALAVDDCVLVGNSLGGAISLKIAIDHPRRVRKLVLMGPGGIESRETYFKMPGIQRMVSQFVGEGFDLPRLRSLFELICYDPRFLTDELLQERMNILKTQPKDVLARMSISDLTPDLPKIQCPVLGFWGIEDHFCPPSGHEKILRAVADARFVMYSRCGHWTMIEQAEDFNRHVIEFLGR